MYLSNLPQMKTINEVSKIINLPKYFVRQLVLQNKVKYVKAGKKYLINLDNFIEYLNVGCETNVLNVNENCIRKICQ